MQLHNARRKVASLRSYAKGELREVGGRLHNEISQIILPEIPGKVPKDGGAQPLSWQVHFVLYDAQT